MEYLEIFLLVVAYTLIIITLFLEYICYKKNLEKLETIAFTFSLLLLIISMTISPFFRETSDNDSTNIFTLLSMTLVSLTTPLSIMAERKHKIPVLWKQLLYIISAVLFIAACISYFIEGLGFIEYTIIAFLVISVSGSMLLVRNTKPKQFIAHREKIDRIISIAFLIVLPISLYASYVVVEDGNDLKMGFTLPLVFIILSVSKMFDNLQRLSLFKPRMEHKEQHFKNYAISEREKEVALLLIQGKAYKQISEELHISIPTVKTHTSTIYKKCGVKNRTELAALLTN